MIPSSVSRTCKIPISAKKHNSAIPSDSAHHTLNSTTEPQTHLKNVSLVTLSSFFWPSNTRFRLIRQDFRFSIINEINSSFINTHIQLERRRNPTVITNFNLNISRRWLEGVSGIRMIDGNENSVIIGKWITQVKRLVLSYFNIHLQSRNGYRVQL